MRPVRTVQVGLGEWGLDWAWRINPAVDEVEIAGYVDSDAATLKALAKRLPGAEHRSFLSLEDAITAARPEALLVTTSLSSHASLVTAALDAGLHVLVEKPFVRGVARAEELVALAAARHLVLMVSQNYRFFPAPRVVQQVMTSNMLGELYQASIDFRRYSPRRPNRTARHHTDDQPLLVDMSIHHFDLLRMLLGREPDRISCETTNPSWSAFAGPSVAVASIRFGGVLVSYRGSWISAGPVTPWAGEWRMEFEGGKILWTSRGDLGAFGDRVVVHERGRPAVRQLLPQMRMDRSGTLTEFARAIREGREPEASGRDNVGTIAFVEAAVESARTGGTVQPASAPEASPTVPILGATNE